MPLHKGMALRLAEFAVLLLRAAAIILLLSPVVLLVFLLLFAGLMAGVLLVAMGVARFGKLIQFIPHPVTTGFTCGIAITIMLTQVEELFGLSIETVPAEFFAKWRAFAANAGTFDAQAIGYLLKPVRKEKLEGIAYICDRGRIGSPAFEAYRKKEYEQISCTLAK